MKLKYADGSKSRLMGRKIDQPNKTIVISEKVKVAKVRACFDIIKDGIGKTAYALVQFELLDDADQILAKGGENMYNYSNWFETKIPENETLIGFRCVHGPGWAIFSFGVITLSDGGGTSFISLDDVDIGK